MNNDIKDFLLYVKLILPEYFSNINVIDIGGSDINGNNRYLFNNCNYIANDVVKAPNINLVSRTSKLSFDSNTFDTIISTQCFEHDPEYNLSLKKILDMLKPNGLFLFTCSSYGKEEHGTGANKINDSYGAMVNIHSMANYYKNLTCNDIDEIINVKMNFSYYDFYYNKLSKNLYFWGIKKEGNITTKILKYNNENVINLTLHNIVIYYHICANEGDKVLNIIKEQLNLLQTSNLYYLVKQINCCLVGNDLRNYNWVLNNINTFGEKFRIVKSKFKNKDYERFTFNYIKNSLDHDLCLYLHSKGITKTEHYTFNNVVSWRKCMEYFLIENAEICIDKILKENYDTVGIMKITNPNHYHGNFWWGKTSYLKELFNNHFIDPEYIGPELFLFKNNPNFCDLYPIFTYNSKFSGYFNTLIYSEYSNHLKKNIEISDS